MLFAMAYDSSQFALWEATLQCRRATNEVERCRILADLLAWLDAHAAEHGLQQVWVFGSVTQPNRFVARSDIDLALTQDPNMRQFQIMAKLSLWLDRDVDVILLDDCPFADKITREGIQWMQSGSAY
ncbi:MAG: nucleotidyltransferase domain-containing protein [Roseiflexaceae bacterium]